MKFIYTNDKYEELGVLKNSSIDFEIGKYDVASNVYLNRIMEQRI